MNTSLMYYELAGGRQMTVGGLQGRDEHKLSNRPPPVDSLLDNCASLLYSSLLIALYIIFPPYILL